MTAASLDLEAMRPLLRGRLGDPWLWLPECTSTQALLADELLPEGAVAVTDHQTAGRGRLDRSWDDSPGTAILASVLLRPPPAADLPQLSLLSALAVAEAVERATELSAQIKWPNDVMLDRRKVAGLLLEARGDAVVCGIGINVDQRREQLPPDARTAAGSLRTVTGRTHDRAALLADVLARLEVHYDSWLQDGLEPLFPGLGARNFLFGRRLTVDGRQGTGGVVLPDGRLQVRLNDGATLRVESGELEVAR